MKQQIPKIIHYCWFGNKPVPEKTIEYIKSWTDKNPDYEIKRWDETSFDYKKYKYTREAYEQKKWAFVSDVCRLEKLYEFGGIYIDVNTEVFKSFDDLLKYDMVLGFEQDDMIMGAFIMAKKGHPFIKRILTDYYEKEQLVKENGKINLRTVNNRIQSELLTMGLSPHNSRQKLAGIEIFPKEYFCPAYWNSSKIDPVTDNTYLIHHFGGSWHDDYTRRLQELQRGEQSVLISVIVPIYKVEMYLDECLRSISNQTYKKLEIILVDDASPDNSGRIADEYALHDERVKVIHKPKNEGLNMARATGFKASAGEYVTFVDSDDMIVADCIEGAVKELYQNKTDFVKFNYHSFKDGVTEKILKDGASQGEAIRKVVVKGKRDLYKTRFVNSIVGHSVVCVWGGLYSAAAVRKIDWQESNYRINEDNFWTLQLLDFVNSGVYTSKVGYLYRSDDSYTGVLSKAMTGNSFNDKPVGYLEFIKDYSDRLRHYNKKYDLGLDTDIDLLERWMWIDRLRNISKANLVFAENNQEYIPTALAYLVQDYEDKRALNETRKEQLKKIKAENQILLKEIKSFNSIQRSARLVVGNIKRKVKTIISKGL